MRVFLEEIKRMAVDLRQGIFHSEDAVNDLIEGIIFRADRMINQGEESDKIKIGRYTLSVIDFENRPKELWIQCEGGEGGMFDYSKFGDAIDAFYQENF